MHAEEGRHILGIGTSSLGKSPDLEVRILGDKALDAWFLPDDEFCFQE